ncbi:MAG: gamma-glutamyl kinase [Rhodobacteraceae bacterium]|nr:gamma-glutamyl kinase [Paracoccaceae bacterium]
MMISTKANLAFLAMPRAASTSIEEALLPFADIAFKGFPRFKHLNLAMYNLRLRPFLKANNFESLETVALFREPVAWLQSWYQYRADPKIKLKRNSSAGVSFNEFVEAYLMDDGPDFAKVGQQSRFVASKTETCGVDILFKFENLSGFADFMSEKFLTEFAFGHANASNKKAAYLSPELERALKDKFSIDYDIYETFAK